MKRLLDITRLLAAVLLGVMASCTDDYMEEEQAIVPGEKALELNLKMSIPGVEEGVQTRAMTPGEERAIDRDAFHVILFPKTADGGEQYVYQNDSCWYSGDKIKWGEITSSGGSSIQSLQITLPRSLKKTPFIVVTFANVYTFKAGETPSDNNKLPTADELTAMKEKMKGKNYTEAVIDQPMGAGTFWPHGDGKEPVWNIPMWGVSEPYPGGIDHIGPIPLLRALARLDVGVNIKSKQGDTYDLDNMVGGAPEGSESFKLTDVRVYKSQNRIRLSPVWSNFDKEHGKVIAPSLVNIGDGESGVNPAPLVYQVPESTPYMFTREIYIPETQNKGKNNDNAFCLVIGGKYNGSLTTSYYRVDFYNRVEMGHEGSPLLVKPTPDNRYDILRNFAYVVNILRVRGPGYATPEEAVASQPINMEVEIKDWEEGKGMTVVATDGQYRLATSVGELNYHSDGSFQPLSVYTDFVLAGRPGDSGWILSWEGMEDENTPVQFCDANGNLIPREEWGTKVLRGEAEARAELQVGMKRFDAAEGGTAEREVKLTFTAGRMRLDVLLTQDTRSISSLRLTPSALSFTRDAPLSQNVVMQVAPAEGFELWAYWNDGSEGRYCFSDPMGHTTENSPVPAMFDPAKGGVFFRKSAGSNIWMLKPTVWDSGNNNGVQPSEPRGMDFTIVAKWSGGLENSAPLSVRQSHLVINWSVLDREGGQVLSDTTLYFPKKGNTSELTRTAWVETGTDLEWYFESYSEIGNFSGEKWLTNWSDLNTTMTGAQSVNFVVTPNPGLAKRGMTVFATSSGVGFDKTSSYIRLEQEAGDVHFQLLPGSGTDASDLVYNPSMRKYTLNLVAHSVSGQRRLSVLANTNFWWEWDSRVGEPDDGTRLVPDDPRWDKILLSEYSADLGEGEANATTNNTNAVDYTWDNVFSFRWPRGVGVFPTEEAISDLPLRDLPKAGRYWAGITLKNKHQQINEAQVAENVLYLDVVRYMPSVVYIEWPLPDGANLGHYTDGATKSLTLGTNNKLQFTVQIGSETISTGDMEARQVYENKTVSNILKGIYDKLNPALNFDKDLTVCRLTVSGPRQEVDGKLDNLDWSMSRTYYVGTKISRPAVVNTTELLLSDVRQVVVLDYSTSTYDKLDVRVTETDVNIKSGDRLPDARPDRVTYYRLDGTKEQRYLIHYMAANNDDDLAAQKRMVKMTVEYWDMKTRQWKNHEPDSAGHDWFVAQDASSYESLVFYPELQALPAFPALVSGKKNAISLDEYPQVPDYVQAQIEKEPVVKDFTGTPFVYIYRGGAGQGDADRLRFEKYWFEKLYKGDPGIPDIPRNYLFYQDYGNKTIDNEGNLKGYFSSFIYRQGSDQGGGWGAIKKPGTVYTKDGYTYYFYSTCTAKYAKIDGKTEIENAKAVNLRKSSTTVARTNISEWSANKADKLEENPH